MNDCLFRYQGQYEDVETGLYYNRFRYYSPEEGVYISQDPIRLRGSNPNFYAYTKDNNAFIDPFGLDCSSDAAKLRKNMQAADVVEPSYKNSAHHIVMSNSKSEKMDKLRKKMKKLGIDINDADNGVYLPTSSAVKSSSGTDAIAHSRINTNKYKDNVYDRLIDIDDADAFRDELADIGDEIASGVFGY